MFLAEYRELRAKSVEDASFPFRFPSCIWFVVSYARMFLPVVFIFIKGAVRCIEPSGIDYNLIRHTVTWMSGRGRNQIFMRTRKDNPSRRPQVSHSIFKNWRMWVTIEIRINVTTSSCCLSYVTRADRDPLKRINRVTATDLFVYCDARERDALS